jgi:hypothetical protein
MIQKKCPRRWNWISRAACLILTAVLASGCALYDRHGVKPERASLLEHELVAHSYDISPALEDRVLALDPEHVSGTDIVEVLGKLPAPRIINIHGGIYPVHERMISFSEFLIGMGYPGRSITNAADGTYTFSCYESGDMIAGMIAWYYEKEGLRPMIIGHSQGGMQAVKILHKFAGHDSSQLEVWNPYLWSKEHRHEIKDPLTGQMRPVVGLVLPFVSSMGAGGLTRMLPNQWDMWFRLRDIPDSVEEFTGFYKGRDLLGGDFWGYGPANYFVATGTAHVRNIELPAEWKHGAVPDTKHLLKTRELVDRINAYVPVEQPMLDDMTQDEVKNPDLRNLLWAEEVWHSIKRHWVLELQRLVKARRANGNGH